MDEELELDVRTFVRNSGLELVLLLCGSMLHDGLTRLLGLVHCTTRTLPWSDIIASHRRPGTKGGRKYDEPLAPGLYQHSIRRSSKGYHS